MFRKTQKNIGNNPSHVQLLRWQFDFQGHNLTSSGKNTEREEFFTKKLTNKNQWKKINSSCYAAGNGARVEVLLIIIDKLSIT